MPLAVRTEHLTKVYRLRRQLRRRWLPWKRDPTGDRARAKGNLTREVKALDDVSLEIEKGTILGIIGRNGAGKSTLLKVLANGTPPTGGRATLYGRTVPILDMRSVFHPDYTGRGNLELFAALHGVSGAVLEHHFDDIVEFAGIEEFLDAPVKSYSSGMVVRLAFSAAVNLRPDILLADEVLAVGDEVFQQRGTERVRECAADGMTVLFVSHDMRAITGICDRVIWLERGRVMADGRPDDVVSAYESAAWTGAIGEAGPLAERGKVRILSVRLRTSDDSRARACRTSDELEVAITMQFDVPDVAALCSLTFTSDDVVAFRAVQPEEVVVTEAGTREVVARIPPHLLADRLYTVHVSLAVSSKRGKKQVLNAADALTLRVFAGEEDSSLWVGPARVDGLVRPQLEWSEVPVSSSDEARGEPAAQAT
jgi:lipopolysaccharide transport system ATP-binding protein